MAPREQSDPRHSPPAHVPLSTPIESTARTSGAPAAGTRRQNTTFLMWQVRSELDALRGTLTAKSSAAAALQSESDTRKAAAAEAARAAAAGAAAAAAQKAAEREQADKARVGLGHLSHAGQRAAGSGRAAPARGWTPAGANGGAARDLSAARAENELLQRRVGDLGETVATAGTFLTGGWCVLFQRACTDVLGGRARFRRTRAFVWRSGRCARGRRRRPQSCPTAAADGRSRPTSSRWQRGGPCLPQAPRRPRARSRSLPRSSAPRGPSWPRKASGCRYDEIAVYIVSRRGSTHDGWHSMRRR